MATVSLLWAISLATASPMVLGLNSRPAGAPQNECRFYNAEFSLISSGISFGLPLALILFVYSKILIALRRRELNAMRRRYVRCARAYVTAVVEMLRDCDSLYSPDLV